MAKGDNSIPMADLYAAAGDAKNAVKAARQELAGLTREMREAEKQGKQLDAAKQRRIVELSRLKDSQERVISRNRELSRSVHDTRQNMENLRRVVGSQVFSSIVSGRGPNLLDAAHLAVTFERDIGKFIQRRLGDSIGGIARAGLKAAPIALQGAELIKQTLDQAASNTLAAELAGSSFGSGQIGAAQFAIAKNLQDKRLYNYFSDKNAQLSAFQKAAEGANSLTTEELTKGLSRYLSPETAKIVSQNFKQNVENAIKLDSEKLGRQLTGEEQRRRIQEALAEEFKNAGPSVIEGATKAIEEELAKKQAGETVREPSSTQLWMEQQVKELKEIHRARARDRVPAFRDD